MRVVAGGSGGCGRGRIWADEPSGSVQARVIDYDSSVVRDRTVIVNLAQNAGREIINRVAGSVSPGLDHVGLIRQGGAAMAGARDDSGDINESGERSSWVAVMD